MGVQLPCKYSAEPCRKQGSPVSKDLSCSDRLPRDRDASGILSGGKYGQMLALVRVALTRPYTFVVLALLILIVGPLAAVAYPVDIFPESASPDRGRLAVHGPAA